MANQERAMMTLALSPAEIARILAVLSPDGEGETLRATLVALPDLETRARQVYAVVDAANTSETIQAACTLAEGWRMFLCEHHPQLHHDGVRACAMADWRRADHRRTS